jgi:hypothetical protein
MRPDGSHTLATAMRSETQMHACYLCVSRLWRRAPEVTLQIHARFGRGLPLVSVPPGLTWLGGVA